MGAGLFQNGCIILKIIYENRYRRIKEKFGNKILINEKLSNYSWFNLGGPADIFFKPDSIEDIIFF